MNHNVMTIAERERLAYLSGDTELAATLAELEDTQEALENAETALEEKESA